MFAERRSRFDNLLTYIIVIKKGDKVVGLGRALKRKAKGENVYECVFFEKKKDKVKKVNRVIDEDWMSDHETKLCHCDYAVEILSRWFPKKGNQFNEAVSELKICFNCCSD